METNSLQLKLLPIYTEHYRNHYGPLDRSCVDTYLESYVSDEALCRYNEMLPTEEEIDTYIKKLRSYQRIRKGGVAFKLQISNDGTAKATDVRVFIDFPEEFFLFDISDIENIKAPKEPQLPPNPIEIAEEKYVQHINPMAAVISEWNKNLNQFNLTSNFGAINAISAGLVGSNFNSTNWSLSVEKHGIVAEIQQIPHRDLSLFDGIYIVPTAKGKFKINVSLMCSEYLEPVRSCIDVEVV